MKQLFRHEDCWSVLWWYLIFTVASCVIATVVWWAFSTKEFKGYYVSSNSSHGVPYAISINWGNSPDETVFKTFDKGVLLDTYSRLNEIAEKNN